MKAEIIFNVKLLIDFTDEEFNLITKAISENKDTCIEIQEGREWFIIMNHRKQLNSQYCELSTRYIDKVLMKSLEIYTIATFPDKEIQEKMISIFVKLKSIAENALIEREKVNDSYKDFIP